MIKNLVFDFGGVIVNINRDNAVKAFQEIGVKQADELLDKYHQRGIFLEVEDGRIDAATFCDKLSAICGKSISFEEAQKGWLGFMLDVPQKRLDLLMELKSHYRILILSNTNPFIMNWARSNAFTPAQKPLDDYVDKIYTSYEAKAVKPNALFFNHVIEDAQINPSESLFIDDGAGNIAAGKELGFNTFQPTNGEDWIPEFKALLSRLQ